jgi:outer membrane receptor protein involved in Fe transport
MKFALFLCFLFTIFFSNFAQTNSSSVKSNIVKGQILDTLTAKNLEFVSVRLFSARDSSVVGGALTDSLGKFELSVFKTKRFYLTFSLVGYSSKTIENLSFNDANISYDLGKISLKSSSVQNLTEVKVIGQLDVFKTGIDKKIYNVSEDLNTQGSSASDVLNNIPSIEVDQDGNISLRGDGNVIILVDGRPSTLTINGGLQGLPANSVERIEVVTNPSAKYDPDGTSGIINIVLKKSKLRGINGAVSTTLGTGNLFNGTGSVNVRTSKINVFANYSYRYSEGYRNFDGKLSRGTSLGTTLLEQNRPGTHLRKNQNLRVGFDYYLTNTQTIGFSVNHALGYQDRFSALNNTFYDEDRLLYSNWERKSNDISEDENLDFNVNYRNELKNNKGTLSADFTTSFGNEKNSGEYSNEYFLNNYVSSTQSYINQRLNKKEDNNVTTGQLDYTTTLTKQKARIEVGAKVILRNQNLDTKSETLNDSLNLYLSDTLANFRYKYVEQITSAYAIWGQQFGKWKYQLGIRGEYAQQIPYLIDQDKRIVNDYFNLFPSGHLRYDLNKKRELSLSYSKRINRANSYELNPFTDYSDPLNLRFGNPYLTPEFINSFDLGYSIEKDKIVFTSSIFYRSSTDVIQRVKVFYDDNITATTYGNIDKSQSYGFEAVLNYKPLKWFRNTLSFNGDRIEYFNAGGEGNFNNSGFNLGIKYSGTVDFWKNTASFQVNVRYNTPRIAAQGKVLPRSAIDISGDKKFSDHWSIGMRLSDVFNTQGFSYDFQQQTVRQTGNYKWLTRRLYFTLTYKFGKLEIGKKENRNSAGGEVDF